MFFWSSWERVAKIEKEARELVEKWRADLIKMRQECLDQSKNIMEETEQQDTEWVE